MDAATDHGTGFSALGAALQRSVRMAALRDPIVSSTVPRLATSFESPALGPPGFFGCSATRGRSALEGLPSVSQGSLGGCDVTAYEELRVRHAADAATAMPEFVGRLDAPRSQIEVHRRRSLRLLLRVAKNYSSWWRERLRDIDPAQATEADLERDPAAHALRADGTLG